MDKMTKRKFIDKWGCEPDEEAPAFVQEIDSKNHAEFLEDLDKLINSVKEEQWIDIEDELKDIKKTLTGENYPFCDNDKDRLDLVLSYVDDLIEKINQPPKE